MGAAFGTDAQPNCLSASGWFHPPSPPEEGEGTGAEESIAWSESAKSCG